MNYVVSLLSLSFTIIENVHMGLGFCGIDWYVKILQNRVLVVRDSKGTLILMKYIPSEQPQHLNISQFVY